MPNLRVHNFAISLDGYGAGPNQNLDHPLGVGGERLHEWVFETRSGRQMMGEEGGNEGIDDEWKGWWGENPPYHHPVFVLTHHPRPPITMEGGTIFNFVDDGIEAALERALDAAEGKDVRLGGGVSTIQQYLRAGLIDEMNLVVVPVLLGGGERLFDHLEGGVEGYERIEFVCSPSVVHARLSRTTT